MKTIEFELRRDFIALDDLLKAAGLAPSGGSAKVMIAAGKVSVDGEVELQKARKVYPGQLVETSGALVRVHAPTRWAPIG